MKSLTSVLLLLLLSVGCSSQTLTRAKAKELIEKRPAEAVTIWTTAEELAAGVQKGLWVKVPPSGVVRSETYQATPVLTCLQFYDQYHGTLTSELKFGIKVGEITGIADAPTVFGPAGTAKIVKFTYTYDFAGCPDVVRTVFTKPSVHKPALFKLYDDGWRFEHF
jgi:hypothetical protein